MNERFERYNEITFEAYCKAAIDNAIHRGVRKKRTPCRTRTALDGAERRSSLSS